MFNKNNIKKNSSSNNKKRKKNFIKQKDHNYMLVYYYMKKVQWQIIRFGNSIKVIDKHFSKIFCRAKLI